MLERLRAARSAQQRWLLVRPSVTADEPWQWRRFPASESGNFPPPAVAPDEAVVLIMPAVQCSHFQMPAPPGLKPHEWPQLLEELLQAPADQVQISCLSRGRGHLELLVVERALIQRWMADCQAMGIFPSHLWAEMQLLPVQPTGQVLRWTRNQDSCLTRADADGVTQWLVWPDVLGDLPSDWQQPTVEVTGAWPSQWAALSRLPNLLAASDKGRSKRARPTLLLSKTQRRLLGVCVVLALCWGAVAAVQFWQQVPAWKAQVAALIGPVGSARQAERQLARLQSEQADWRNRQQQVAELELAVEQWLDTQREWGVSGSYFDGRTWRLVLSGGAVAPAPAHWQAMAKAAGATVKVEPDDKAALLTLHFSLDGQP